MALRAAGRLSSRMRMWPELGAGRSVMRTRGPAAALSASVEYCEDCERGEYVELRELNAARDAEANRAVRRAAGPLSIKANLGGISKSDCLAVDTGIGDTAEGGGDVVW